MATSKQKPSRRAITRRRNAARRLQKSRETPLGRLGSDGASSPRNINRRLLWLAIEIGLEAPPKVGRTMSGEFADYCMRHRINYDWMLDGCLKGLKQMMDERRGRTVALSPSSFTDKLARLSETERELVLKTIQEMLPEHRQ
ncbi:hypothetical protein [Bradyrhizobium sp.]|jgi:hypothetical protein|uniref:hypothetical protein n=1 Tax=Bradyrhizobium sp. TaxID=376 RepID=UPI002DDD64DF|nr:hypothetical protein [Bradyrhizobium sp.]HEV2156366.1 hypothetical protein [Bradyrhizobium sp.]